VPLVARDGAPGVIPRAYLPVLANDGAPLPPPDTRYDAPEVFYTGDTSADRIYLTFDDCYSPSLVSPAMDTAEAGGARLTFFPVGSVIPQHPDLWRNVLDRGHAIENHTYTHPALSTLSDSQIRDQLVSHIQALQNAVGSGYQEKFIRPPYGDGIFNYDARIPAIAADLGLKVAMWTADSNGWRLAPRTDQDAIDYVISNVMQHFGRGSIILQHVLGDDVLALPSIVARANDLGYECVTLRAGIK
jgi:peptidoglycan-N-acetylmuramic acid deacetylase